MCVVWTVHASLTVTPPRPSDSIAFYFLHVLKALIHCGYCNSYQNYVFFTFVHSFFMNVRIVP